MKNDFYNFRPSYRQIGRNEDITDWFYTYVEHQIVSKGLTSTRYNSSGTAKVNVLEAIKHMCGIIGGKLYDTNKDGDSGNVRYAIVSDDFLSCVQIHHRVSSKNQKVNLWFTTGSEEIARTLEEYIRTNFTKERNKSIYVIAQEHGGLTLHSLGVADTELEKENYSSEVLESYDYIIDEYNKKEPFGRLSIINGPPGVGKTYFLRGLMSQMKESLIVLLPTKLVSEIDSPNLISLLAEQRSDYGIPDHDNPNADIPILFVIEDADACLVPRENDNILTISSLLNYTDGILGSMLDLRILATTNAERVEFDAALTRPGRMCRHVYVGPLSSIQAERVYKRLTGKDKLYKENVTLAEVYADAHGGFEEAKIEKKKLGFK